MKPVLTVSPTPKGFTLIELVVVVAIMALTMGGGMATYTAFRSGKIALREAQVIGELLKEARSKAIAGEKPAECSAVSLTGYKVDFTSNTAELEAVCPGGSPGSKVRTILGTIDPTAASVTFSVLSGGATNVVVDICTDDHLFRINISSAGNITEPTEITGGC